MITHATKLLQVAENTWK